LQDGEASPDFKAIQARIVAKKFDAALTDLDAILSKDAENTEALYMKAVCHRYLRQFDQAHETLGSLRVLMPELGRAHQEEGHTWRDMGRPDEALKAYARACRHNPALEASWRNQLAILLKKGLQAEAAQARAQLDYLQKLPAPLVGVMDLVAEGRLLKAEDLCRQFLQKVPHHVDAMRLLADIGMRLGVLDDAEFLLESATKFDPANIRVKIDYIKVLQKRQKFDKALQQAGLLLESAPENPQFQSIYAIESMQCGDYDTALIIFEKVLKTIPGDAATLTSKGHALKTSGRYDEAVGAYRGVFTGHPQYGEAWYSLANLKVYEFAADEIDRMRAAESNADIGHLDRLYLCFALGKAFEDRGEFETAFGYYARGNRLKKAQSRYDAGQMSEDLGAQQETCTAELFESRMGGGHDAPDPIFVVGLPRAGSTLIEQILSSHSQIDGTLELPNVLSLSQRLRRRGRQSGNVDYPAILHELTDDELEEFGREYIRDTRIHRQDAPFFIDKMPNNFRHVGLIRLILPNAKIIDARRGAMACCFSGFKQLFAEGQEFTYDLEDLGLYYRDYIDLIDHWNRVLPGLVLTVNHEEVVHDLETQVRRMLEFCGLPFEESCLEFHRTDRNVRTPSSEQVRQPIYTSGLEQWRNFEPWLLPLKTALGPALADSSNTGQAIE
jgi:tetratricopeptide (TPR) repeat protein